LLCRGYRCPAQHRALRARYKQEWCAKPMPRTQEAPAATAHSEHASTLWSRWMNFFPPREVSCMGGLSSELWSPKFWEPNSDDLRRGLYAPLKVFFPTLVSQRVQRSVNNTKKDLNGRNHELNSRKYNPSKKYRIFESIKLIFEHEGTSHTRRDASWPSV
jgi:hypothetical protein